MDVEDGMIEDIRNLMRSWGWTETMIDRNLPRLVQACIEIGILVPIEGDGFEITDLLDDEGAWDRLQRLLQDRGIGGQAAA